MTLNDIELATYRRTGYADVPATEVVTRIRQWINIWQQRLLSRPGVTLLRDVASPASFLSVPLQPQYQLPTTVRRIQKIYELVTPIALRMESLSWIREMDPGARMIGIPEVWAPMTWQLQPPETTWPQLTIRLWPIPGGATNYFVDGPRSTSELALPTDVPLLPFEYHWLLVEAACYEEWMRKADTRSGTARQDLETGFKEMRNWVNNVPDYRPTNMPAPAQPSRLGGFYPSW